VVGGSTPISISGSESTYPEADASVSFIPGEVCVVLTADCLPILLCDETGTRVGAIHAGWKGLAAGVIEATVERLACMPSSLMAWLGPAIGPDAFEVGEDVVEVFKNAHTDIHKAFKAINKTKWKADIYTLARLRLEALGITRIFGGDFCTYTEQERFYSARRAAQMGSQTGRMATLIWRTG
jgi:YfiH family protein